MFRYTSSNDGAGAGIGLVLVLVRIVLVLANDCCATSFCCFFIRISDLSFQNIKPFCRQFHRGLHAAHIYYLAPGLTAGGCNLYRC